MYCRSTLTKVPDWRTREEVGDWGEPPGAEGWGRGKMRLHSNSRSLWGEEGRVEERNIEEKCTICYRRRVRNAEKEQVDH